MMPETCKVNLKAIKLIIFQMKKKKIVGLIYTVLNSCLFKSMHPELLVSCLQ